MIIEGVILLQLALSKDHGHQKQQKPKFLLFPKCLNNHCFNGIHFSILFQVFSRVILLSIFDSTGKQFLQSQEALILQILLLLQHTLAQTFSHQLNEILQLWQQQPQLWMRKCCKNKFFYSLAYRIHHSHTICRFSPCLY